jgi:23S rRNA (cytidine1920-2'-O)/16S rRNA (cytidine1409-2'-O)-methyltransferase
MTTKRLRLDAELVRRGLARSRDQAAELIAAGRVEVSGAPAGKAATQVGLDAAIIVREPSGGADYVSRGGHKLAGALAAFGGPPVAGRRCLDAGASTGGFTEVLLANGASLVFAIDVGRGQLHHSLQSHPNIVSMEETDIRNYEGKRLPARPDIVVIDVSFISLKAVLPVALSLAAAPMHLLALIKPQFEAPRKHTKRGIIRNAMVHQEVCDDIAAFVVSLGCTNIQVFPSSIAGGDGNIEFFIGARRG